MFLIFLHLWGSGLTQLFLSIRAGCPVLLLIGILGDINIYEDKQMRLVTKLTEVHETETNWANCHHSGSGLLCGGSEYVRAILCSDTTAVPVLLSVW